MGSLETYFAQGYNRAVKIRYPETVNKFENMVTIIHKDSLLNLQSLSNEYCTKPSRKIQAQDSIEYK